MELGYETFVQSLLMGGVKWAHLYPEEGEVCGSEQALTESDSLFIQNNSLEWKG